MPEPGWTSWVIDDQAAMDACATALFALGYGCTSTRGYDTNAVPFLKLQINVPTDQLNPRMVAEGQAVILMGDLVLVLTADQYANSPFYEGD